MWWIIGFSLLICILYFILISIFFIGWKRTSAFVLTENDECDLLISVIVPCRDEEKYIRSLISSLKRQTYKNYELILVNDHSHDATRNYIEAAQTELQNILLIDAVGLGKKNALREGIHASKGNLIVTTDTDCIHSPQWLQTIAAFQSQYLSDLIICPVMFSVNNPLISNIQKLEFVSLVAAGAGAAGVKMPILCNGANLAFTRDIWMKCQATLHEEEQSGDDIFLLESIKKQGGVIRFLKSTNAFALTKPADSINTFFKQRRRWTSKAPVYTDWQIIFTACVVLAINFLAILLLCFTAFNVDYLIPFFCLFSLKYLFDSLFLISVKRFFQLQHVWLCSLILSAVYPLYIVIVALSTLIVKPKSWK